MSTENTKPEGSVVIKPGAALPGQTVVAKGKTAAILGKPTPTFGEGSLLKDGRPESIKAVNQIIDKPKAISPDPRPSAVPKPSKPVGKPVAPKPATVKPKAAAPSKEALAKLNTTVKTVMKKVDKEIAAEKKAKAKSKITPKGKALVKSAFAPKPGAAKLAPGKAPVKVAHKKPETQKPKPGDNPEVVALLKKRDAIRTKLGSADPAYQDLNGKIARLRNPEKYRAGILKRRPKLNEAVRARYQKDPKFRESVLEAAAKWRAENKKEIAAYNSKRKDLPQYRGATTVRNYVTGGLKRPKNGSGPKRDKAKFLKMIGCTREEFQKHIEKQFTKGMTFETFRSNWTFEFIHKLADYDLSKETQQQAAANYKNVRVVALE